MSFDLAVWHETARVSSAAAAQTYARLCEGDHTGVAGAPEVGAFHRELTAEFPESDGDEASPWASGIGVSDRHVLLATSWSRAGQVVPRVRELADRHGLVCFDPQASVVHLPRALRGPRPLDLERCAGPPVADPDREVLERAVRSLSEDDWYLIVDEGDGRYVQVGLGRTAGVGDDEFAVEHRDGAPDRHERCVVRDRDAVVAAVLGFAAGDASWRAGLRWERLDL
ncbi:hypothetical protein [Streptomyces sp. MI02-7b]|uniref:hypothetical protein n=1 Tax=Streptomyces sp. MI02-7b TaxID=462941 RepID=UPI0029B188DA|nr:hypothetical protein [Streptomyces sp. MI02-7b]MDX3074655.1 hypothetical protein [Streptomyces sp. MI02-7b]